MKISVTMNRPTIKVIATPDAVAPLAPFEYAGEEVTIGPVTGGYLSDDLLMLVIPKTRAAILDGALDTLRSK